MRAVEKKRQKLFYSGRNGEAADKNRAEGNDETSDSFVDAQFGDFGVEEYGNSFGDE